MRQSALDRRTFMAFGLAGGLGAIGGFGANARVPAGPIALKPIAHSRTVSGFARLLLCDAMPQTLRKTIEAELARTDGTSAIPALEREHATLFARLAVWNIAPRALRAAGYETLAANCERQTCLKDGSLALAGARYTIGRQSALDRNADLAPAYAVCVHAATTALHACEEDIGFVTRTGGLCGRTLLVGSLYDKDTDADRIWNFAAMAINAAIDLGPDRANELLA